MNKSQLLKKIKANKDEINRLKTENETLQSTAVLKGYARWVYNKNGELQDFNSIDILSFNNGLIVHKDTYYKNRISE